jgi:O-antigen/teichoic acid export membrane protein
MTLSTWVACLMALAGTLFAPFLIAVAYGDAFGSSVLPFQIAIWMIPLTWLSGHFRFSLVVAGHHRLSLVAAAGGALATVLVSLAGARLAGAPGAAFGLVAGGIVGGAAAAVAVFRVIGTVRLAAPVPALAACAGAVGVAVAVGPLLGQVAAAVLACGGFAVLAASRWDLGSLRGAWHGRPF